MCWKEKKWCKQEGENIENTFWSLYWHFPPRTHYRESWSVSRNIPDDSLGKWPTQGPICVRRAECNASQTITSPSLQKPISELKYTRLSELWHFHVVQQNRQHIYLNLIGTKQVKQALSFGRCFYSSTMLMSNRNYIDGTHNSLKSLDSVEERMCIKSHFIVFIPGHKKQCISQQLTVRQDQGLIMEINWVTCEWRQRKALSQFFCPFLFPRLGH